MVAESSVSLDGGADGVMGGYTGDWSLPRRTSRNKTRISSNGALWWRRPEAVPARGPLRPRQLGEAAWLRKRTDVTPMPRTHSYELRTLFPSPLFLSRVSEATLVLAAPRRRLPLLRAG
ncbi:hypothetical protein J6590_017729 [Homalodisca vitripennis]|nr:hypothetical protein J6590_017729 [Homalodisca vitripennis]